MKIILSVILVFISTLSLLSQQSFRIEWDTEDNLVPGNGIIDNEGNTVIVGYLWMVEQNFNKEGFIFKMTPEGDYLFNLYPPQPDSSIMFLDVIQSASGNYFVIGKYGPDYVSNPNSKMNIYIYNQELILLEEKEFALYDNYNDIFDSELILEADQNILCAASIKHKTIMGQQDLIIYRFNELGDTIESKLHAFNLHTTVFDIDKIPNENKYLILEKGTQAFGDFECLLLNNDLSISTINYHSCPEYSVGYAKTLDYWYPDKTFLMASDANPDANPYDVSLGVFRCDTLANINDYILLNRLDKYDQIAHSECMAFADENSIYIAGHEADYWDCADPDSIELYVVDTALNQVAYKSLGGDLSYDVHGVFTAKDKSAIVYGTAWHQVEDNCYGNLVIYYINREELGLPPVKVFDITPNENKLVYPNPSCNIVNIQLEGDIPVQGSRIKLYNANGKKIYDYGIKQNGNTLQLNISNLEQGIYFFKIVDEKQIITQGEFIKIE